MKNVQRRIIRAVLRICMKKIKFLASDSAYYMQWLPRKFILLNRDNDSGFIMKLRAARSNSRDLSIFSVNLRTAKKRSSSSSVITFLSDVKPFKTPISQRTSRTIFYDNPSSSDKTHHHSDTSYPPLYKQSAL